MTDPTPVTKRHDFVLFFDVTKGNPNGDPDAGNMPRIDPETGQGLVSDVCIKRKVRNYVELAKDGEDRFHIYVTEGAVLNEKHRQAYRHERPEDPEVAGARKLTPRSDEEAFRLRRFMCDNFYDIRTFGAVLSTGINCGQVRGPVQFTFATSIEPVLPMEVSITRMAATSDTEKKELEAGAGAEPGEEKRGDKRTMGRKHIIPYGLYRAHGFVSAPLASHATKGTGFTDADLDLLWEALGNMFEHDRSAARGEMTTRALVVFEHEGKLGNAHADKLFGRVKTWRRRPDSDGDDVANRHAIGAPAIDNWPPARSFDDYAITVDEDALPAGVRAMHY